MTRAEAPGAGMPALEARALRVVLDGPPQQPITLLDGVDLALWPGRFHALVGESGSGKSLLALALLDLLPAGVRLQDGAVLLHGAPRPSPPRTWRGKTVAAVFQDPLAALHPFMTVGAQLVDALRAHQPLSHAAAWTRAQELLAQVGIADAPRRARQQPHALSGGMRQRATLALALCNRPAVLLADEPTTALDALVAAQVLALLAQRVEQDNLALLFITHDLALAAQHAHTVAVMHAGAVVEEGPRDAVWRAPAHPYTRALLRCSPAAAVSPGPLPVLSGSAPRPGQWPPGCRFAPRCERATAQCTAQVPLLQPVAGSPQHHRAACFHPVTVEQP